VQERRTIEDLTKELATTLKQLGIKYAIIGGIAATSWGNIRTTLGIDVVLDIKEKDATSLVGVLTQRSFSLREEDIVRALREKTHFTIFDDRSVLHIDAKGSYGARELQTLRTRRKVLIDETECYLASPEDMIANKLFSGSGQDIRDAEGIYARQYEHLDMNSLRSEAERLGVAEELTKMEKRVRKRLDDLTS
jgi:hypothetical protein